ncbi:AzlD domain-containing protein [Streptococcus anginosus]|uniref:Branched-chain amino acid transport protein n=1 Tax=Streptococcus anginosus TaxID=1328 RepID=A0A418G5Q9_STRAP|nr:AzlD domain-containing protein [Streptococcus anginosus]GAD40052.1 predicted membrane protein [Streptococcus intermedius SK54 = ATCC 27335]MBX9102382.1 AzlD domain-containing protein [Streptococcus anginosus]MBZ2157647.1 AzlD domain-containing protein [Streptococcus anginosus]MCY7223667.1 AzlD domain-containing protein [Streptococcus anginosus]ORE82448.1 branched-chain amino acid permease [Streptococcus anginosus SK52 = DSM 20563]
MINNYIFVAILLSALVTWLSRLTPFILVKYRGLPKIIERFLQYLPVSIVFALILSSITKGGVGQLPTFKWLDLIAVFPTIYIAFRYRNLVVTVIFGVVLVAGLRFIF